MPRYRASVSPRPILVGGANRISAAIMRARRGEGPRAKGRRTNRGLRAPLPLALRLPPRPLLGHRRGPRCGAFRNRDAGAAPRSKGSGNGPWVAPFVRRRRGSPELATASAAGRTPAAREAGPVPYGPEHACAGPVICSAATPPAAELTAGRCSRCEGCTRLPRGPRRGAGASRGLALPPLHRRRDLRRGGRRRAGARRASVGPGEVLPVGG